MIKNGIKSEKDFGCLSSVLVSHDSPTRRAVTTAVFGWRQQPRAGATREWHAASLPRITRTQERVARAVLDSHRSRTRAGGTRCAGSLMTARSYGRDCQQPRLSVCKGSQRRRLASSNSWLIVKLVELSIISVRD